MHGGCASIGFIALDPARYSNISELYRVGYRGWEAVVRGRRFRVTIYEALHDREGPIFSASYEEEVAVVVGDREWPVLVKANLPWEAADTVEECLEAALAHVNTG
jgi:hypothetical protein